MNDQVNVRSANVQRPHGICARVKRRRRHFGNGGYTLIEMIVAMIVTGVLLSIGVPGSSNRWSNRGQRGRGQPAVHLVGPEALLAGKPNLCSRLEHAAVRKSDRSVPPHGNRAL